MCPLVFPQRQFQEEGVMKKLIGVIAFVLSVFLLQITICPIAGAKKENSATEKCVEEGIKERSVVIGKTYADPGGNKKKAAKQDCEYEKSKGPKKFQEKYGGESSGGRGPSSSGSGGGGKGGTLK
jgi:hypothetical protein